VGVVVLYVRGRREAARIHVMPSACVSVRQQMLPRLRRTAARAQARAVGWHCTLPLRGTHHNTKQTHPAAAALAAASSDDIARTAVTGRCGCCVRAPPLSDARRACWCGCAAAVRARRPQRSSICCARVLRCRVDRRVRVCGRVTHVSGGGGAGGCLWRTRFREA
jgi:hypothetical protein